MSHFKYREKKTSNDSQPRRRTRRETPDSCWTNSSSCNCCILFTQNVSLQTKQSNVDPTASPSSQSLSFRFSDSTKDFFLKFVQAAFLRFRKIGSNFCFLKVGNVWKTCQSFDIFFPLSRKSLFYVLKLLFLSFFKHVMIHAVTKPIKTLLFLCYQN